MWRSAWMALAFVLGTASAAAAQTVAATLPSPALRLGSAHAIVVDEATGEVLFEKNSSQVAPIASLTKLMTAMVVLDARQDPQEMLSITEDDLDRLKHTRFGVRVGTRAPREAMLELALIASDNHAASALARHYPGGSQAFRRAVDRKIASLGLEHTVIEEPTGLSPRNRSSAADMAKVVRAAAAYPQITESSTRARHRVQLDGRDRPIKNTNRLVGAPGWNILLSKTGFTNEAGRCVSMRMETAGRTVAVVLMGAVGSAERALDADRVRRWLAGETLPAARVLKAKAVKTAKAVATPKAMGTVGAKARGGAQHRSRSAKPQRPTN